MKKFFVSCFCLLLSFFTRGARREAELTRPLPTLRPLRKNQRTKSGRENLLNDANKALAAMIKAARADKGLDPKTAKNKPFWKPAQLVARNLSWPKMVCRQNATTFLKVSPKRAGRTADESRLAANRFKK